MSRGSFAILMIGIAVVILTMMWIAWRGRRRGGSGIVVSSRIPGGRALASFSRVAYVSTTPVGSPLERAAIPGLAYKGPADLEVLSDGVRVQVAGEDAVFFPAQQIRGTGTAGGRVGKFVERDGLVLLRWVAESDPHGDREFESSFRIADVQDQRRFAQAIDALLTDNDRLATQEDA